MQFSFLLAGNLKNCIFKNQRNCCCLSYDYDALGRNYWYSSSQRALLQKRLFQSHSRTPSRIKVTAVGAASSPLSHHYYNNYYQEIKVSLEGHQANQSVKIRDLSNKWSKVYKKALLSHLYFQKLLCPFFTKTFLIGFSRSC